MQWSTPQVGTIILPTMIRTITAACLLAAVVTAAPAPNADITFEAYVAKFEKTYTAVSFTPRMTTARHAASGSSLGSYCVSGQNVFLGVQWFLSAPTCAGITSVATDDGGTSDTVPRTRLDLFLEPLGSNGRELLLFGQ